MKRYEMPMVELTKFDVEDIMVSGTPAPVDFATAEATAYEDVIKANVGAADAVAVYNW